jgi:hypothetical protein
MIFISAYTPRGFIDNTNPLDFGAIARFVENNFALGEGSLGFADARSTQDLGGFYRLDRPRPFVLLPTRRNADWFIHDTRPKTPPDDD